MNLLFTLLLLSGYIRSMGQDILRLPVPPQGDRIAYGTEPLQFGELRLPVAPGPYPVVVVIHGGFWRAAFNLDHISHLCVALNQAGVATWSIEYRRIGDAGGGWPGTFQDVAAGTDYLRTIAAEHNLDLNRVVLLGHSAGGHLALWLAGRGNLPDGHLLKAREPLKVAGVVSLAGVADLKQAFNLKLSNTVVAELLGGSPESVADRYRYGSPSELIPLGVPQRLIHGTLDTNVPFEISRNYVARSKAAGDDATLLSLDTRHFELIDPRAREFESVRRLVMELLK